MSDITLSKSVRSNLVSLQQTADLIAQTQTRLSTGKKVNSALDNPMNFFTSQSLIVARRRPRRTCSNSVSNAVQTLQAADNGITSLTKLVQSAQAIAQQAQQSAATTAKIHRHRLGLDGVDRRLPPPRQDDHGFRRHHHRDLHAWRPRQHGAGLARRREQHGEPEGQGRALERRQDPARSDRHQLDHRRRHRDRRRTVGSIGLTPGSPRPARRTLPARRSPPSTTTCERRSTSSRAIPVTTASTCSTATASRSSSTRRARLRCRSPASLSTRPASVSPRRPTRSRPTRTSTTRSTNLTTALGTLRSQASTFGSNLSVVQTRQDFTKATDQHAADRRRQPRRSPTPTRKAPTCSRCRPASRCRRRRCRSPPGRPERAQAVRRLIVSTGKTTTAGPRPRRFRLRIGAPRPTRRH